MEAAPRLKRAFASFPLPNPNPAGIISRGMTVRNGRIKHKRQFWGALTDTGQRIFW